MASSLPVLVVCPRGNELDFEIWEADGVWLLTRSDRRDQNKWVVSFRKSLCLIAVVAPPPSSFPHTPFYLPFSHGANHLASILMGLVLPPLLPLPRRLSSFTCRPPVPLFWGAVPGIKKKGNPQVVHL